MSQHLSLNREISFFWEIYFFFVRWINNFSTVDALQLRIGQCFLLNYLILFYFFFWGGEKFIRFGVEIFFCPLPGLSVAP